MFCGKINFYEKTNLVGKHRKNVIFENENMHIESYEAKGMVRGWSTKINGKNFYIAFHGEVFNQLELKKDLGATGFHSADIYQLLLLSYYVFGPTFVKKIKGNFAIAIWDEAKDHLYMARDHLGVIPLFYNPFCGLEFSTSLDVLAKQYPQVDMDGLREIFGIGPARTPGTTPFKKIFEILPGHFAHYTRIGLFHQCYYELEAKPHTDNFDTTIETIRDIVTNSIIATVHEKTCSLLSGGVDSTIVTAIAAKHYEKTYRKKLATFSFDYVDNNKYFSASDFQPQEDRPFVELAVKNIKPYHTFLEIDETHLIDYLYKSVDAKALPGMGDIDSSILVFLEKIYKEHGYKSFLTGESADEIFGGYPWFVRPHLIESNGFPWSKDTAVRSFFLEEQLKKQLDLEEYSRYKYQKSLAKVPVLKGENKEEARLREIYYLNLQWFMSTLVDRSQRAGQYIGILPRMPYADPDLVSYMFNVPWSTKLKDGIPKYTLRHAFSDLLPTKLINRKKSPFPKTYNPAYTEALGRVLTEQVLTKNSKLYPLLDIQQTKNMINHHRGPWFGQLMQGPQQMAYLIQIEYWMQKYKIELI